MYTNQWRKDLKAQSSAKAICMKHNCKVRSSYAIWNLNVTTQMIYLLTYLSHLLFSPSPSFMSKRVFSKPTLTRKQLSHFFISSVKHRSSATQDANLCLKLVSLSHSTTAPSPLHGGFTACFAMVFEIYGCKIKRRVYKNSKNIYDNRAHVIYIF